MDSDCGVGVLLCGCMFVLQNLVNSENAVKHPFSKPSRPNLTEIKSKVSTVLFLFFHCH